MTAAEINALPFRVKTYIHDLETRCDPAGDIRALWAAREQVEQLTAKIAETKEEVRRLADKLHRERFRLDYPAEFEDPGSI